jgi:hypothetical protein
MFRFNPNSFSHWCIVILLGWTTLGLIVGLPLYLSVDISGSWVFRFVAVQCALNLIASPWLFAARATTENPHGKPRRFLAAEIIWLTAASVAACLQLLGGDFSDKAAVCCFIGMPILLGTTALVILWLKKPKSPTTLGISSSGR